MGFRLKLREPLPDGLKKSLSRTDRICSELCRRPARQRRHRTHEVRKHLKSCGRRCALPFPKLAELPYA
jgi:hypothetical protein